MSGPLDVKRNACDNRPAPDDADPHATAASGSGSSLCSSEYADVSGMVMRPEVNDPNKAYALIGKIPQTNEQVSYIIRSLVSDLCPWLKVIVQKPDNPHDFAFCITFADVQSQVGESDSKSHPETLLNEATAASRRPAG